MQTSMKTTENAERDKVKAAKDKEIALNIEILAGASNREPVQSIRCIYIVKWMMSMQPAELSERPHY